jgi:hypothetical protein
MWQVSEFLWNSWKRVEFLLCVREILMMKMKMMVLSISWIFLFLLPWCGKCNIFEDHQEFSAPPAREIDVPLRYHLVTSFIQHECQVTTSVEYLATLIMFRSFARLLARINSEKAGHHFEILATAFHIQNEGYQATSAEVVSLQEMKDFGIAVLNVSMTLKQRMQFAFHGDSYHTFRLMQRFPDYFQTRSSPADVFIVLNNKMLFLRDAFIFLDTVTYLSFRYHNRVVDLFQTQGKLRTIPMQTLRRIGENFLMSNHKESTLYCHNQLLFFTLASEPLLAHCIVPRPLDNDDITSADSDTFFACFLHGSPEYSGSTFAADASVCMSTDFFYDRSHPFHHLDAAEIVAPAIFYLNIYQDAVILRPGQACPPDVLLDIYNNRFFTNNAVLIDVDTLSNQAIEAGGKIAIHPHMFALSPWNEVCKVYTPVHPLFGRGIVSDMWVDRAYCESISVNEYANLLLIQNHVRMVPYNPSTTTPTGSNTKETLNNVSLESKKRRNTIYIYEWVQQRDFIRPKTYLPTEGKWENDGFGPLVLPEYHLYQTPMHSLFEIYYSRAERLPLYRDSLPVDDDIHTPTIYRTLFEEEGELFLIPYNIGLDCPAGDATRAVPACPNVFEVMLHLLQTKAWQRNGGRDHVLVISTLLSNLLTHSNCAKFVLEFCRYCILITIEDLYRPALYLPPSLLDENPAATAEEEAQNDYDHVYERHANAWNRLRLEGFLEDEKTRVIAVPFPSCYHYPAHWTATDFEHYFRTTKFPFYMLDRAGNQNDMDTHTRSITSMYMGSNWVSELVKYRTKLIEQCLAEGFPICKWVDTVTNVTSSMQVTFSPSDALWYTQTAFCFMPKGPTHSRKALNDAILSGCFPVVFHLEACHYLNPFHIPLSIANEICIYYPLSKFQQDPPSLFHYLQELQASEALRSRRQTLWQVMQSLQYAVMEEDEAIHAAKQDVALSDSSTKQQQQQPTKKKKKKKKKQYDAFDVTFSHLLQHQHLINTGKRKKPRVE